MKRPAILVTNDDGIHAPGIAALAQAMESLGDVWVVAPASEQSAVSHAISLRTPLRVSHMGERRLAVTGTPADCVYVALHHLLPEVPALCVSGINHGANLGDDVIYSGTVAGAIEGTLADIPSIAFSLAAHRPEDFSVSAQFATVLAKQVLAEGLPRGVYLNVNVPEQRLAGNAAQVTKLGRRNYRRTVVEKLDPRSSPYYWLGGAELGFDDMPGSDCNAVAAGMISVTPVHVDMTHYALMREIRDWSCFAAQSPQTDS